MPKCFKCHAETGGGGVVQENGTVLCGKCDLEANQETPGGLDLHCVWCGTKVWTKLHQTSNVVCPACKRSFAIPQPPSAAPVIQTGLDTPIADFLPNPMTLTAWWLVTTIILSTIVFSGFVLLGLAYGAWERPGFAYQAFCVLFTNLVFWGFLSGIGFLIYKGLKGK